MKGMLMDGYTMQDKPSKIKTIEEFFALIQEHYDSQGVDRVSPDDAARGIINMLMKRVGEGEMKKVPDNMPEKIRPLFQHRTSEQAVQAGRRRTTKRELEVPES
jgi:uncharacterized protein (DUF2267 family)